MARALLKHPSIILADEPTGNLDPENAEELIRHLAMFRQRGGTVVVVTHGNEFDGHADHIYHLDKGQISKKPYMKGEETE
jgi:ABC-type lipoprotein export system ATPase subunit